MFEFVGSVKKLDRTTSVDSKDKEKERYSVVIKGAIYDAERDQEFEFQLTIRSPTPIEGFQPKQQFKVIVQPINRQASFEELREAAKGEK
ncbi:MAG: hypothetical protein DRO40_07895 [Thermoprotei archaeon]|mgnify:CR=1 FL=1|nr:MAG: hypothetical protein DRO40_07895 [Thermoprotei archaeon]